MLRTTCQRVAAMMLVATILGGPVPSLAAPAPARPPATPMTLQVQAPTQITIAQPFAVQISLAASGTATLSLVDDTPQATPVALTLAGTLQAPVVNGTATFAAVMVNGQLSGSRTIRLIAVAVDGARTVSGASASIELQPPPAPTYRDAAPGGLGIDCVVADGKLIVYHAFENQPGFKAGIKDGDQIMAIDGKSIEGDVLDGAKAMAGPVGSTVVVSVKRKGSDQLLAITAVRGAIMHSTINFITIPNQPNEGAFQVSVKVVDGTGQPVPDAHVAVSLDPKHSKVHTLFITTQTRFKDGSGAQVEEVSGVTGADGIATVWVRIGTQTTPADVMLLATVKWHDQLMNVVPSNVFSVFDPSN